MSVEEKKFPIYKFNFRWNELGDTSKYKDNPRWTEGLPEGRIWNGTGFSKMFKEEQTQEFIDKFANDWWENYKVQDKNKDLDFVLDKITAEFKENESWFLTWFSHETIDIGQTDEEVLQSFESFVRRKEELNYQSRIKDDKDVYCLMGAEDRWRWRGADENGNHSDNTPPPCRCKFCKEQGVIRIGH